MSKIITRLRVRGLHGAQDIDIEFNNPISIFMGPNGIGKSTVLNIFVGILTKQWHKLAKQAFDEAEICFDSGDIALVSKIECVEYSSIEFSPRMAQIANVLSEVSNVEEILDGRMQYGNAVTSYLSLISTGKLVTRNFDKKLIYLPTYRRIEQDITDVFSMSPGTFRRIQSEIVEAMSRDTGFTELVRFGMEDISQLIDGFTSEIKEYSRQQINSLSTRYLVAALQSRQSFAREFFSKLTDNRIRDVLARVDDEELDQNQRVGLTNLIKDLRIRDASGRLTRQQEHIAGYFPMLANTHGRISKREEPLRALAAVLNKYIGPSKTASYDQTKYEFTIRVKDSVVPLAGLSSGEKQIVSLFATLMLIIDESVFVVIDEPELSLSVLWQEILIEDIFDTPSCANVLAVTHSPFIFGERLARYTRDLSDHAISRQR